MHLHRTRAVDVDGRADGATVHLADGTALDVDAVLLAQGHLDASPTPAEQATAARAARHGLTYLPTAYTADVDLSVLAPGEDVLVRGAGLAFVDLAVLLTSGRGGTFERTDDGRLRYLPSGREPVLHVGSRRGVPYRPKIGYPWAGPPVPLRFFTPAAVDAAFGAARQLDLRADLAPLIARELGWAHYTELFRAFPERTALPWEEFAGPVRRGGSRRAAPPWPPRRCPTRPTGSTSPRSTGRWPARRFDDADELQDWVRGHVRQSLDRAADPRHSADSAVFLALLLSHGTHRRAGDRPAADPALGERGPGRLVDEPVQLPGQRPAGPAAGGDPGAVGGRGGPLPRCRRRRRPRRGPPASSGPARPPCRASVTARALVEARVPAPDVRATPDELVTALLARGEATERVLPDPTAPEGARRTGKLDVDPTLRVVTASGGVQPRLFAVGFWTAGAQVAAFARPRTNAPFFRQNDALARRLWTGVVGSRAAAVPVAGAA